jgi:Protein of unknown function (DUF2809)
MPLTFNKKYLLMTAILLTVEICIALFFKDTLIRPFVGDALVVILIYCFLGIFLNIFRAKLAFGVFLFACCIEVLQYFDYVKLLHLESYRIISIILGRTFEWLDFIAYLTGFLLILAVEKFFQSRENHHNL